MSPEAQINEQRLEELVTVAQSLELVQELTRIFLDYRKDLDGITDENVREHSANVAFIAHKLKGASANLGALGLARFCEEFEDGVDGVISLSPERFQRLRDLYSEVCQGLLAWIHRQKGLP